MPDQLEEQRLEDQLATFTDHLLAMEPGQEPDLASQEETLHRLQKTVQQLKHAGEFPPPDREFAARLKSRVLEEWEQARFPQKSSLAQPQPVSLFQRLAHRFLPSNQRGLTLRLVLAMFAVLLLTLVLLPKMSTPTPGSAGSGSLWQPVVGIVGLLCATLIVWLLQKKRE